MRTRIAVLAVLAAAIVAVLLAVGVIDTTSEKQANTATAAVKKAAQGSTKVAPLTEEEKDAFVEAKEKVAAITRADFDKVEGKDHSKNGRVVVTGFKGLSVAEKVLKWNQYAMEDPVVAAALINCHAPRVYTKAELDQLARSEQGGERHWRFYREVKAILSTLKNGKNLPVSGAMYNEGRTAAGQQTVTPEIHNNEPATMFETQTQVLPSGRVMRGGKHITLDRCGNCQTQSAPVGVPVTRVPGRITTKVPPSRRKDPVALADLPRNKVMGDTLREQGIHDPYGSQRRRPASKPATPQDKRKANRVSPIVNNDQGSSGSQTPVQTPDRTNADGSAQGGNTQGGAPVQDQGGATVQEPTAPASNHDADGKAPAPSSGSGGGSGGGSSSPPPAEDGAPPVED